MTVTSADAVDRFLTDLARFLLRHSAEGAFDLRYDIRRAATALGVTADVLTVAEGAVVTVGHADGTASTTVIRVYPELARLDLVAEGKFLIGQVARRELTAAEAGAELAALQRRPVPYRAWLRAVGVVLFAAGFAPSVQATWTELGDTLVLGAVMGIVFILAERATALRPLLPIAGPLAVGLVAFGVLHAHRQPGGPMILMVPALFVLIPGDFMCAATAEVAVGQLTPGAVRMAQALFTLVELAAGVIIAAEITGAGTRSLFESQVPPALPYWLVLLSWIPFAIGLMLTFSARPRDLPWILLLTYLGWGVQIGVTRWLGPATGTFTAALVLAVAAGLIERSPRRPPRIVVILGGFFALTVGALVLRGLTTLDGGQSIQGFNDVRDAVTQTVALTLGLIVGTISVLAVASRAVRPVPGAAAGESARL